MMLRASGCESGVTVPVSVVRPDSSRRCSRRDRSSAAAASDLSVVEQPPERRCKARAHESGGGGEVENQCSAEVFEAAGDAAVVQV